MPQQYPISSKSDGRESSEERGLQHGEGVAFGGSGLMESVSQERRRASAFHRLPEGTPPLRILVVDDDASLRKACCEIASGMGFVTLAAGSVAGGAGGA